MRARHDCEVAEEQPNGSLQWPRKWRSNLNTCVVQPRWLAPGHSNHVSTRHRLLMAPEPGKRKKKQTTARRESLSLDKGMPHKG